MPHFTLGQIILEAEKYGHPKTAVEWTLTAGIQTDQETMSGTEPTHPDTEIMPNISLSEPVDTLADTLMNSKEQKEVSAVVLHADTHTHTDACTHTGRCHRSQKIFFKF